MQLYLGWNSSEEHWRFRDAQVWERPALRSETSRERLETAILQNMVGAIPSKMRSAENPDLAGTLFSVHGECEPLTGPWDRLSHCTPPLFCRVRQAVTIPAATVFVHAVCRSSSSS